MSNDLPQTVMAAATGILRPLIKILLRYGITHAAFCDLAKQIYFEVAKSDFAIPGKKQTSSRISTMTGLSRKEVAKLEAKPKSLEKIDASSINRAARVISGWTRDKEFNTSMGVPADLPFEGDNGSFTTLVKKYSGDITARTIADELSRTGAISMTASGLVHLSSRAYIANDNEIGKLTILGSDVSDLITTIDHNLVNSDTPRLQRKVAYNYIPVDSLPELQSKLKQLAQNNLEVMDRLLAKIAVKKNRAKKGVQYARVGVGVYYFESEQT